MYPGYLLTASDSRRVESARALLFAAAADKDWAHCPLDWARKILAADAGGSHNKIWGPWFPQVCGFFVSLKSMQVSTQKTALTNLKLLMATSQYDRPTSTVICDFESEKLSQSNFKSQQFVSDGAGVLRKTEQVTCFTSGNKIPYRPCRSDISPMHLIKCIHCCSGLQNWNAVFQNFRMHWKAAYAPFWNFGMHWNAAFSSAYKRLSAFSKHPAVQQQVEIGTRFTVRGGAASDHPYEFVCTKELQVQLQALWFVHNSTPSARNHAPTWHRQFGSQKTPE